MCHAYRENVNNLKKCRRGTVLILGDGYRLFSVERKLVLVNMYRLLLFILSYIYFSVTLKWLDDRFSAVNICVLTIASRENG